MDNNNKGRWLIVSWEENFDDLENIDQVESVFKEGILFINPPFAEITLSDGFWGNLNFKFGKMFDFAEEEDIESHILAEVVEEIKQFSKKKYDFSGLYEISVGKQVQPENKAIVKKMPFEEIQFFINTLCDFLLDANRKNKNVIIIL